MICLSIGENCATDKILQRFNIKSYATPYSFVRSNIFYALQLENSKYDFLLDSKYLKKDPQSFFPNFYRNYNFEQPEPELFDPSCANGFEFTHHNVIDNPKDLESMKRKIARLLELRNSSEDIVFFYHHRYTKNCKIEMIITYLNEFCDIYSNQNRNVTCVLLEQRQAKNPGERHVFINRHKNVISSYFYTNRMWVGRDKNVLFGKNDDDLIFKLFYHLAYEYNVLPHSVIIDKIKSNIEYK